MKTLSLNNSIFSRIKDDFKNILSFSDADKFTTDSEEISLPTELKDSLKNLEENAHNFESNGISSYQQEPITKSSTQKPRVNRIKPISKEIKTNNVQSIDDEREL